MQAEPTIQDVLEAISDFSVNVDGRFDRLETDVSQLKTDVTTLKTDVTALKADMVVLKMNVTQLNVKTTTIDDNVSGLRSDLILLARRANTKLTVLIEELVAKGAILPDIAKRILALEPFPQ